MSCRESLARASSDGFSVKARARSRVGAGSAAAVEVGDLASRCAGGLDGRDHREELGGTRAELHIGVALGRAEKLALDRFGVASRHRVFELRKIIVGSAQAR